jgi:hypothetical protein
MTTRRGPRPCHLRLVRPGESLSTLSVDAASEVVPVKAELRWVPSGVNQRKMWTAFSVLLLVATNCARRLDAQGRRDVAGDLWNAIRGVYRWGQPRTTDEDRT